ncbi:MAG: hypothetical protein HY721_29025 [Planctomycetes bacterium]|nr:hypothetical protein [Planctomycetota bacterium]
MIPWDCWDDANTTCGSLSGNKTARYLCTSDYYQCIAPCTPALAEAKWQDPGPPVEALADWVPAPPPGQTSAWLWVDGLTQWNMYKAGYCCYPCNVNTTFHLQSWIFTDIHSVPPCAGAESVITDETRTFCSGNVTGVDGKGFQLCATSNNLPKAFKISARNRSEATRASTCTDSSKYEYETTSLKTYLRPKCSKIRPF